MLQWWSVLFRGAHWCYSGGLYCSEEPTGVTVVVCTVQRSTLVLQWWSVLFRGAHWCYSCGTYCFRGAYSRYSGGTPCFRGAACHVSQGWPGGGAESHRSSTPGQQGQATQDVPSVDPVQVSQTPVTWKSPVGYRCQHMHDSHVALACLFVCGKCVGRYRQVCASGLMTSLR